MSVRGAVRGIGLSGRPLLTRFCWYCGQLFTADNANAQFCCRAHQMRQWRAIKMLEGTHAWLSNGHFGRVA